VSDLRPDEEEGASATLVLRSFRAVMAGPVFCWDLFFVETAEAADDPIELPAWLDEWDAPLTAALGGPALMVKQNLEDRVFVTAQAEIDGTVHRWLTDREGVLRWVRLQAREGRAELLWCLRVEGGSELGTPIAQAWTLRSTVRTVGAQLVIPGTRREEPAPAPAARGLRSLPPEIDDEGRDHDDAEEELPPPVPLRPRARRARATTD
jgi:hypothetical protein